MTSSYLGLAALDACFLVAGFGVLHGIGLVRSGGDALGHGALALLVGWAVVGIATSFALMLGAPVNRWVVGLLALAIAVASAAVGRRVPGYRAGRVDEPGAESWLAVAGAAIVLVQLAALLRRALGDAAPLQYDAWSFWLAKARTIVDFGGLDTAPGGFTSFANPGYPPFVPVVDASAFAFMGNTNATPLSLQHWVLFAAFLGALASLLSVRVRPAILWPCLAFLSVLPTLTALIGSSLGDETLILLIGVGGACAAVWLLERNARYAALAALFFAAAALAKNEGLPIALVMAVTMLGAALARRPRRVLAPVLVLLAPIGALVPWKVWLRVEDVQVSPDYRLSDLFHPSLLADRFDRLSYGVDKLPGYMFSPGRWLLAVPLMLVAVFLVARRRPALAVFALAPVVAIPAGLLLIWWIGYPAIDFYVATTGDRVPATAVVLAAIFLPLLLAETLRRDASSP